MDLLPCHHDSYRRRAECAVLACEPNGAHFAVRLQDSIFYPGGGGQPADSGRVGDARILTIHEDGMILLDAPVSGVVPVELDWARRFDHMQQHSAQHLITAVILRSLGHKTIAFHLNPDRCDVVLDTPGLSAADLARIAVEVNAEIRAARPVSARLIDRAALTDVRYRRLPPGDGPLRVIEIDGVDRNTCGGTHVTSTAELQLVHLLGQDHQKGTTRLHWLAGGRALSALDAARDRGRALNELLCCGPEDHVAAVRTRDAQLTRIRREAKGLRDELAEALGARLTEHLHRKEADLAFLGKIARAALRLRPQRLVLITGAPDGATGVFLVAGPVDRVRALGPKIAALLEGRGGGRGEIYQGKATRIDRRAAAAALLTDDRSACPG